MLQFLRDYRVQMADGVAQSLFKGKTVTKEYIDEVASKCGAMEDVETLEADDINLFYGTQNTADEKEKI